MMRTCPPCTFGMGRTRCLSSRGRSSPPCASIFFARTGTCVGCAGKTARIKNCTSPPHLRRQPPSPSYLKWLGGNGRGAYSLAAADRLLPPTPQALLGLTSQGKSSRRSGVEAKRQLAGKSNLPKTCVANRSVELDPQPDKTINSSASTPSPASPQPLALTHGPAEGTPLDPETPASIYGPALSASTPPSPVRPTPAPPLCPDQPDPAPLPLPAPRPNSVTFGPGIAEALPYVGIYCQLIPD